MGTAHPIIPLDGEGPARQVSIPPFYLDKYEVTNVQFAKFIAATGHVTDAQRFGDSFVLDGESSDNNYNLCEQFTPCVSS